MTVVPVAYPATSTATPYGAAAAAATAPAHNIYQGQIVYTSDQYNPANATNSQVPQYYPVGYTYPAYNGNFFFLQSTQIALNCEQELDQSFTF